MGDQTTLEIALVNITQIQFFHVFFMKADRIDETIFTSCAFYQRYKNKLYRDVDDSVLNIFLQYYYKLFRNNEDICTVVLFFKCMLRIIFGIFSYAVLLCNIFSIHVRKFI